MHTAGPWHRNIRANGHYPVIFSGRNNHVATASQQADPAETEANIDLIAAAPDLLDALRRVMRHIPADAGGASLSDDMHRAHKAIKKATGAKP